MNSLNIITYNLSFGLMLSYIPKNMKSNRCKGKEQTLTSRKYSNIPRKKGISCDNTAWNIQKECSYLKHTKNDYICINNIICVFYYFP